MPRVPAPWPGPTAPDGDLQTLLDGGSVAARSDAELLVRLGSPTGPTSEAAFAALVARHGGLVWRTCRRILADPTDADDAFQGTFLVLLARAGRLRLNGADSLGRWLHGVARRVAARTRADRTRLHRRAASERSRLRLVRSATPEPAQVLAQAEALAALDDEVARLPEAFRAPLILCDLGDLTHEQAALALGCPVGTVKSRLARGRNRLRDRLAARGFRPEAVASGAFPLALAREPVPVALVARVVTAASLALAEGQGAGFVPSLIHRWFPFSPGGFAMNHPLIVWPVGLALAAGIALCGWFRPLDLGTPADPPASPPQPVAAPVPAAQSAPAPAPATQPLAVEVRDLATNRPVVGHRVHLRAWQPLREADATTDAAGVAHFTLDGPTRARGLDVSIGREGGLVPIRLPWEATPPITSTTVPPNRFTLRTEPATTINGLAVDPDGQSVAGASVVVMARKVYAGSAQRVDFDWKPITTDSAGRWSISGLPAAPDAVEVSAWHPLHRTHDETFHKVEITVRDGLMVATLPPRGTAVDGVVVDPTGRPVVGAEVLLGGGAGYGNQIPPVRTDDRGAFHLGVRPGTTTTLTATHPGFGPVGQALTVGDQPQNITLTLPAALTLSGWVETSEGRPIAEAYVVLAWEPGTLRDQSRRQMPVNVDFRTDADGRFTWTNAPSGPVRVEITAPGYTGIDEATVAAGSANRIVLQPPTHLIGRVVDVATGQPIPDFRVTDGAVWRPGERLIWQESTVFPVEQGPGIFTMTAGLPADRIAARISAPDYFAEETATIPADGEAHEVTVRLTRGEPLTGRAVRPDGSPAVGGLVYLNDPRQPARITNGTLEARRWSNLPHAAVGSDGTFRLPPQREAMGLVIADPTGVSIVPAGQFRAGSTLTVQPWAQVEGTLRLPNPPPDGYALEDESVWQVNQSERQPTAEQVFAPVDREGSFRIDRLSPGRHHLGYFIPNGPRQHWFVRVATIDAAPGAATTLRIGERGRAVVGRVALPARPTSTPPAIDVAKVERASGAGPDDLPGVDCRADGRFRVADLPPGDYRLTLTLREPDSERPLGRFRREFTVPAGPISEPIDLGLIEPEL